MAGVQSSGPGATRYRKRRPLPALAFLLVLGVAAAAVWIGVLDRTAESSATCETRAAMTEAQSKSKGSPDADGVRPVAVQEPVAPIVPVPPVEPVAPTAPRGQVLAADALDSVAPAPPQLVRVQVLNGGSQRGAAGVAAADIYELGFTEAAPPVNDPLHPDGGLACVGQIRFGTAGEAAARTLSLVIPCAELVRDVRPDDVVDLSVGTEFPGVRPSDAARTVLTTLTELGSPAPASTTSAGGQAAAPVQPTIDSADLAAARNVAC